MASAAMRLADTMRPAAYAMLNIVSASGIVFANKAVMSTFGFRFVYALTLIHTLFTWAGMAVFRGREADGKRIRPKQLLSLSAAFVGYVVLCNLNLRMNPVGFYQISKIAVAPAVLTLQALLYGQSASRHVVMSILVVCAGVGLATVTDPQVGNLAGVAVGIAAVLLTAVYQLLAGAKQKELGAGSMQLLQSSSPIAATMLLALTLGLEPLGLAPGPDGMPPGPDTILGYDYTPAAVAAILLSAFLGLLVSLSTFLVIGATSSLTYNVVGHVKTVIILGGGTLVFGEQMPPKKLLGMAVAMVGIIWYSHIRMAEASAATAKALAAAQSRERDAEGKAASCGAKDTEAVAVKATAVITPSKKSATDLVACDRRQ